MKEHSGWTNYEERLGRVTAYIHDHLDEELDLNRLAEVVCLSPHHRHRFYHANHGETSQGAQPNGAALDPLV